jgi:hypothetical protein
MIRGWYNSVVTPSTRRITDQPGIACRRARYRELRRHEETGVLTGHRMWTETSIPSAT